MKYELDDLTAENGSVLGNLVLKPSKKSLGLSPDLADRLRMRIVEVNAALAEGARDSDVTVGRRDRA